MKLFKLSTWINAFLTVFIVFIGIRFFTPNHPTISADSSLKEVQNFIKKVIQQEANNIKWQYIDTPSHMPPVNYLKATEVFFNNLEQCNNNKKCLIKTYDNYMDKWVSDKLRRQTRAYYMIKKFGLLGEFINKAFFYFY